MNTKKPQYEITIIGAGKVGTSFASLFSKHHQVNLIGRSIKEKQSLITDADFILITTNDGAIEAVCNAIKDYIRPNTVVSHCSGALTNSILNSAKQKGAYIASSHPLNTFPSLEAALTTFRDNQHGTYLYCEGDKLALKLIHEVFEVSGFKIVDIPSEAKIAYHTACVFACNYLSALMDLSLETAALQGIDKTQFWQAIQPLIQATLSNITQHGTSAALSGPIARGDGQTVSQHIDFLSEKDQSIGEAYLLLAEHALKLATQQGKLSEQNLSQLKEIIKQ